MILCAGCQLTHDAQTCFLCSAKTVASQGGTFRLNWIHLWTRVKGLISEIALDILVSLD